MDIEMVPLPALRYIFIIQLNVIVRSKAIDRECQPTPCGYIVQRENNYLSVGSDLNLTCVISGDFTDERWTSYYPYFVFKDVVLPTEHYRTPTKHTMEYFKSNISISDGNSNYNCMIRTNSSSLGTLIDNAMVKVGDPPSKIDQLTCVSPDHMSMTCSWRLEKQIPGIYNLSYSLVHSRLGNADLSWISGNYVCFEPDDNGHFTNCSFNWCSTNTTFCNGPRHFSRYSNYAVKITGRNNFGRIVSTFNVSTDQHIVQPSRVHNLTIIDFSSRGISITWSRPPRLPPDVQVEYCVSWCTLNNHKQEKRTLMKLMNISSLHPYTHYTITVSSKPIHGGSVSPPATIKFITRQEVPSAPPIIPEGGYRVSYLCGSTRDLFSQCYQLEVLWKEIPRDQQNGPIQNYTLRLIPPHGNPIDAHAEPSARSQVIRGLKGGENYQVALSAYTEMGESPATSVTIRMAKTASMLPTHISAGITLDRERIHVTWSFPQHSAYDVDNYTLLWCEGTVTGDCKGEISFHVYSNSCMEGFIKLTKPMRRPLVAIAANYDNFSSGFSDWICIYENDMVSPDWEFSSEQYPHSITIHWQLIGCVHGDRLMEQRITSYIIWWRKCSTTEIQHIANCSGLSHTVSVDPYVNKYTISDLDVYSVYAVRIYAVSGNFKLKVTLNSVPEYPPTNVTIVSLTQSSYTLSWNPCWVGNRTVSNYHISVNGLHGIVFKLEKQILDFSTITISGLRPGATYLNRIRCCNAIGCSPFSNSSVTTYVIEPPQPSPVHVHVLSANKAQVSWSMSQQWDRLSGHIVLLVNWAHLTENGLVRNFSKNTTVGSKSSSKIIDIECNWSRAVNVTFRAVLVIRSNNQVVPSQPSNATTDIMCLGSGHMNRTYLIISLMVSVFVLLVAVLVFIYICYRHQNKKVRPRVPPKHTDYTRTFDDEDNEDTEDNEDLEATQYESCYPSFVRRHSAEIATSVHAKMDENQYGVFPNADNDIDSASYDSTCTSPGSQNAATHSQDGDIVYSPNEGYSALSSLKQKPHIKQIGNYPETVLPDLQEDGQSHVSPSETTETAYNEQSHGNEYVGNNNNRTERLKRLEYTNTSDECIRPVVWRMKSNTTPLLGDIELDDITEDNHGGIDRDQYSEFSFRRPPPDVPDYSARGYVAYDSISNVSRSILKTK